LGFDKREFENAMKDPALMKIIPQDVRDGRNAGRARPQHLSAADALRSKHRKVSERYR
jgi:hypothetical protein